MRTETGRPGPAFEIDPGKLAEEVRYDGLLVPRTNTRVTPLQAVLRYRDLLQVIYVFSGRASVTTAPRLPSADRQPSRSLRPTRRPPGSRTGSVRACQVLRPRRVGQVLALALLDILPSTTQTVSAPGIIFFAAQWLACTFPCRTLRRYSSRMPAHGLGPMWVATPSSQLDLHHLSLPVSRRTRAKGRLP